MGNSVKGAPGSLIGIGRFTEGRGGGFGTGIGKEFIEGFVM